MPCPAASAVQQLITDAHVPGLSMAVLDDRQATALTVGVRNSLDRAAVDQQTIFGAASLSKPLFAYAVLKLVDAGKLAFDTPLSLHVPDYVADDPRAAAVTVRHVLSHTSGLPNWRSGRFVFLCDSPDALPHRGDANARRARAWSAL